MMYGYGIGWGWMTLMPLLWIAALGMIIWAVVRLAGRLDDRDAPQRRESAQEILDRRFASGEIDADTYAQARARLAGQLTPK